MQLTDTQKSEVKYQQLNGNHFADVAVFLKKNSGEKFQHWQAHLSSELTAGKEEKQIQPLQPFTPVPARQFLNERKQWKEIQLKSQNYKGILSHK